MSTQRLDNHRFGPFEIIRKIGEGGMGTVYQARQSAPERFVALKVIRQDLLRDPLILARFSQEAKSAARLAHPNIVPIHDVSEVIAEGRTIPYISMLYVEGQTLRDRLQARGPLPVREAAEILRQAGAALDYAHQQRIIHRDLKPSNMMIAQSGNVYLMDFGLARDVSIPSGVTVAGTFIGTPEYMSPEQAEGRADIGPASDIYALGLILYEMLTGKLPFHGETPQALMVARLTQPPIPPSRWVPTVSGVLEEVVMQGIARLPEYRFKAAGKLVEALQEAAGIPPSVYIGAAPPPAAKVSPDGPTQRLAGGPPQALPPAGQNLPKTQVLAVPPAPGGSPPPQIVSQSPPPAPGSSPPPGAGTPRPPGWGDAKPISQPGGGGAPYQPPPPPKQRNRALLVGGIIALALLLMGLVGGGVAWQVTTAQATQTAVARSSATAEAVAVAETADARTATAETRATATAEARGTATAEARATQAAQTAVAAGATQTAIAQTALQATQTAVAAPVPPVARLGGDAWQGPAVFGPVSDRLEHDLDGVAFQNAGVTQTNFVVDASFTNPYGADEGQWDYGLLFRSTDAVEYRLILDSDQAWSLRLRDLVGDESSEIASGELPRFDLRSGDVNRVRLIAMGSVGYLFVNDTFVSELDISTHLEDGDIAVATGIYSGYTRAGASTAFADFAVWDVPAQSLAGGQMPHNDDDQFEVVRVGQNMRDFLVRATFTNPYASSEGGWDYGFTFRRGDGAYYVVVVDSAQQWAYGIRRGDADTEWLDSGSLDTLTTGADETNTVGIIVSGRTGLLYINDALVAELDLSEHFVGGDLQLITGLIRGHETPGRATSYDDLRVWTAR